MTLPLVEKQSFQNLKMSNKTLDIKFQEAFEIASNMKADSLPQDVMLRLYAYYKQATFGTIESKTENENDLRNAFKTNAWMQISHISNDDAKEKYIDIINEYVTNKK